MGKKKVNLNLSDRGLEIDCDLPELRLESKVDWTQLSAGLNGISRQLDAFESWLLGEKKDDR